jgi:hypothetical protein
MNGKVAREKETLRRRQGREEPLRTTAEATLRCSNDFIWANLEVEVTMHGFVTSIDG